MKRSVPIALALVALFAFAALAGCADSGDSDQARSLVKKGDAAYKAFEDEFLELADMSEKLFARYSHGVESDPDETAAALQDYQDRFNKLLEQVKQAKVSYSKVLGMEGVKVYKDYAERKLKLLGKVEAAGTVLEKTFPIIAKAVQTGKSPDATALESAKRELIGLEMELSFIEIESQQLAEDSGLLK